MRSMPRCYRQARSMKMECLVAAIEKTDDRQGDESQDRCQQ
jgi:hypothetical protein